MTRYATPLITKPPLPAIENQVEVLIAESRLAHPVNHDSDDVEEEQLMTVLVSFDPAPAQRWSARALAATFITAECMFEQLPARRELDDWLGGLLNSRVPASLCLVIALPDFTAVVAEQVDSWLKGLTRGMHHIQLVVAVASSTKNWLDSSGIDGFVSAKVQEKDRAALEVFNMLAALMAPGMLNCLDAEDFRSVFGSAERPSGVAGGVWLNAKATLLLDSAEDYEMVRSCSALAVMPLTIMRMSSVSEMLIKIRSAAQAELDLVLVAPWGMVAEKIGGQTVSLTMVTSPLKR
jgi:hypothetical protein